MRKWNLTLVQRKQELQQVLPKHLFERTLVNNEKVNREWLVYSESTRCVYCVPCKVFGGKTDDNSFKNGYRDWKNAHNRVKSHENSMDHKICIQMWHSRASIESRIDRSLIRHLDEEKNTGGLFWSGWLK